MTPADFFRSHGLVVDDPRNDGAWHRVPTDDHPKKRNGAYRWDGEVAFCQNWATMSEAASWKDDTVRPITVADRQKLAAKRALAAETQEKGWARAAARAQAMLEACTTGQHGYLARKGFKDAAGLVTPEGCLFVPMRVIGTNELVGGQVIQWLPEERRWEKKFTAGMRAKGAVFAMGQGRETFLCEGFATGMSIEVALRSMRLSAQVVVCFSAHNVTYVAERVRSPRTFVVADHDASGAGAAAAEKTGLPWAMPPEVGEDANDMAVRQGSLALANLLMSLRRRKA